MLKNILLWFGITAALTLLFDYYSSSSSSEALDYSAFVRQVQSGQVRRVSIDNVKIEGEYNDGARFVTVRPPLDDDALMADLLNHHVIIQGKEPERQSLFTQLLVAAFPFLIIFGIFMLFARQLQSGLGGRGGPMSFGRSRAKLLSDDQPRTTFADVAGVDEAKDDVQELVEFLRDPARFQKIGGRIPRGVLMVGAPGHRQDLAGQGDLRRGASAVLFHLRFGFRRDVRRRRRLQGARHVRAGQKAVAVHHLHRRDRRRGPPSRRRPGRRPRRTRTDAEPTARGNGRLQLPRRRHRHRRDQPARRSGPGLAASWPL